MQWRGPADARTGSIVAAMVSRRRRGYCAHACVYVSVHVNAPLEFMPMSPQLHLLPPVPPPVGLYIRPGWNDHVILQQLIVEGRAPTGLVFDARFGARYQELVEVSVDANLDSVLDSNVQELWSPAGRLLTGLDAIRWSSIAGEGARGLRGPDPVHSVATERPSQCPITGNRTPPGSIQRRASSALCRLAAP